MAYCTPVVILALVAVVIGSPVAPPRPDTNPSPPQAPDRRNVDVAPQHNVDMIAPPGANKNSSLSKKGACGTHVSEMTANQKRYVVYAHNVARRNAKPRPDKTLPRLTWDDSLASRAQALADTCRFDHDLLKTCDGQSMGQNLALIGSDHGKPAANPISLTHAWINEDKLYDYATGGCSGVCGHYTAVVWEGTTRVGCGTKFCSTIYENGRVMSNYNGVGYGYLYVCDYSPAGNYAGQKPFAASLIDKKGQECQDWIYQYCGDAEYGSWAGDNCALTCNTQTLTDAMGTDECQGWVYQYCNDVTYEAWAEANCARTCASGYIPSTDAMGKDECEGWVWQYCDDETYKGWAWANCGHTCGMGYIPTDDKMGSDCTDWGYQYCNDAEYSGWSWGQCARTCMNL